MDAKNEILFTLTNIKKRQNMPCTLQIDRQGNVYIDGARYEENNSKFKGISVSTQNYTKVDAGEETQKLLESAKKFKKGETAVIKDIQEPDRKEKTTVTF